MGAALSAHSARVAALILAARARARVQFPRASLFFTPRARVLTYIPALLLPLGLSISCAREPSAARCRCPFVKGLRT